MRLRNAPADGQRPGPFSNQAFTAVPLDEPLDGAGHFDGFELVLVGSAVALFGIALYLWA